MNSSAAKITLSVVSHGQGHLIRHFLEDLRSAHGSDFEVILTLNIPEDTGFLDDFADLPLVLVQNATPKGFGANHNAAFTRSRSDVFVIVNPDIRSPGLDLGHLIKLARQPRIGAAAPRILSPQGRIEDSARRFPTIARLAARVLLRRRAPDYNLADMGLFEVEWVAGMFVVFPRAAFEAVHGFDERYFMYMEDVDICHRLARKGFGVRVDGSMSVVHDAQRASRRSLRHLRWHARSAIRYLLGI